MEVWVLGRWGEDLGARWMKHLNGYLRAGFEPFGVTSPNTLCLDKPFAANQFDQP
jgi:hypothetical protein